MSDIHIEAADTNMKRVKAELDWAREHEARVFIAGDLFEAIFPGDPRWNPSVMAKRIRKTNAPVNAALDDAVDFFTPYADLLDLIGYGNHESKVIDKCNYDMIDLMIELLCAGKKHRIRRGGYMGVIRIPMNYANAKRNASSNYTIAYHHGFGSSSGQSKGVLAFNKVRIEGADCIWMGHLHARTATPECTWTIPQRGDMPHLRHILNIRTGAYKEPSWQQHSGGSYEPKWSRENGMDLQPESLGGARLWLELNQGRIVPTLEMVIA